MLLKLVLQVSHFSRQLQDVFQVLLFLFCSRENLQAKSMLASSADVDTKSMLCTCVGPRSTGLKTIMDLKLEHVNSGSNTALKLSRVPEIALSLGLIMKPITSTRAFQAAVVRSKLLQGISTEVKACIKYSF